MGEAGYTSGNWRLMLKIISERMRSDYFIFDYLLLQVRVQHKNEKELAQIQKELKNLKNQMESENLQDVKVMERMDHLVRRIDGLQEAFKTGDAKHLVSKSESLVSNIATFLFCLLLTFICHNVYTFHN